MSPVVNEAWNVHIACLFCLQIRFGCHPFHHQEKQAFGYYLYYNVVGLWACHNGVYRLSKVNSECKENEQHQNKNNNKIIANLKFC